MRPAKSDPDGRGARGVRSRWPVPRRPRPRPVHMSRSSPAGILGSIFGSIGHAVLGAFSVDDRAGEQVHPDHDRRAGADADPALVGEQGRSRSWSGSSPSRTTRARSPRRPAGHGVRVRRDQRAARPVHVDRRRAAAADVAVRHDASDARRARACRRADRARVGDRGGAGLLPVLVDAGGGDDRHGHAHGLDAAARRRPACTS